MAAVRRGQSLRQVARRFQVHLRTVQRWVKRADGQRVDRADFSGRKPGPQRSPSRVAASLEDRILTLRRELKDNSPLGEYGAAAILRALQQDAGPAGQLPCLRSIGRVLQRCGALDGQRRVRRPPPPRGWYLPAVGEGRVELDSFDIVQGLVIRGGLDVEVLNGISLHGGLCVSWPASQITAKTAVQSLIEHWRSVGLPAYAQFDNDTLFQGAHQYPDSFGRVTRLCLSLGVVPVFTPPREPGFQAAVESYNARWQAKVWRRFEHASLHELCQRSAAFVAAVRQRGAVRIEEAPRRGSVPQNWQLDLQAALKGRVIYLRRADASGQVQLLGRCYAVAAAWPHRLVRAEVDLSQGRIRFHRLRRRDPGHQPLLAEVGYEVPRRRFKE